MPFEKPVIFRSRVMDTPVTSDTFSTSSIPLSIAGCISFRALISRIRKYLCVGSNSVGPVMTNRRPCSIGPRLLSTAFSRPRSSCRSASSTDSEAASSAARFSHHAVRHRQPDRNECAASQISILFPATAPRSPTLTSISCPSKSRTCARSTVKYTHWMIALTVQSAPHPSSKGGSNFSTGDR